MKKTNPEHIAHALPPQLAVDVLRACGYTRRAAHKAIAARADPCKGD